MADKNSLLTKTEMENFGEPEGLLEHFNLPPKLITFLRTHQKRIWTTIGCAFVIIIAVSLYGSYHTMQLNKASAALDNALRGDDNKESLLHGVVEEHGTTPAALWAKVELAKHYEQKENFDQAAKLLTEVSGTLDKDSFLVPLVTYRLAVILEKQGHIEEALGEYTNLSQMKGFVAIAYKEMGRLNEQLGKPDQAIGHYKKYLEEVKQSGNGNPSDPTIKMIETRVQMLGNA